MGRRSKNQSVFEEPHHREDAFIHDPSEARVKSAMERAPGDSESQRVEHGVWDEPAITVGESTIPDGAMTYAAWIKRRRERMTASRSWVISILLALAAGPLAVIGTFWGSGGTWISLLALVLFGPAIEEVMKTAAIAYVVEKRPYLLRSRVQIMLSVLVSGVAFAAIENVLYLRVYIPDPSPGLVQWRWTVCVALHAACCMITGLGLSRMWKTALDTNKKPDVSTGFPYLLVAVVVHGAYNAFAIVLSATSFQF